MLVLLWWVSIFLDLPVGAVLIKGDRSMNHMGPRRFRDERLLRPHDQRQERESKLLRLFARVGRRALRAWRLTPSSTLSVSQI